MKPKLMLFMLLATIVYGQTKYKIVIPDSSSISGYAIILNSPDTIKTSNGEDKMKPTWKIKNNMNVAFGKKYAYAYEQGLFVIDAVNLRVTLDVATLENAKMIAHLLEKKK